MRKRDRDRIVKKLRALSEPLQYYGVGQIEGSMWYFDNDAEIKGFDVGYAAAEWAIDVGTQLKALLDQEAKRSNDEFRKRLQRKRERARSRARHHPSRT